MTLMQRRRALMGVKKDSGKIMLFANGVVSPKLGGFEVKGPNDPSDNVTVTIGETIDFTLQVYIAGSGIKTLCSSNKINAQGKTLKIKVLSKRSDTRGRNCWFYAYASNTVIDTSDVPASTEIQNYFPAGDGAKLFIPSTTTAEVETEMAIPITQNDTYISIGALKTYIYVEYFKVVEMWLE